MHTCKEIRQNSFCQPAQFLIFFMFWPIVKHYTIVYSFHLPLIDERKLAFLSSSGGVSSNQVAVKHHCVMWLARQIFFFPQRAPMSQNIVLLSSFKLFYLSPTYQRDQKSPCFLGVPNIFLIALWIEIRWALGEASRINKNNKENQQTPDQMKWLELRVLGEIW